MPRAVSGLEPFDSALPQNPRGPIRILVSHAACEEVSERRDARVRMQPEAGKRRCLHIEVVEKYEGLEHLAKVRRADQPGDGPLNSATGPMHDLTGPPCGRCGGFSHGMTVRAKV